jgi:isocitrate lyase
VIKRGTLIETYASDVQAKKLWTLLEAHQAAGTASRTYGALDPIQVAQMAKYLDTIYVSGWQCSSTASSSNEPGPDLADYPMVFLLSLLSRILCQTRLTIYSARNCSTIVNSARIDWTGLLPNAHLFQ